MIGNKRRFIPVGNSWSIAVFNMRSFTTHDSVSGGGAYRWVALRWLRIGDAESEHQADVQVRAVIDRAFGLEEMRRDTKRR